MAAEMFGLGSQGAQENGLVAIPRSAWPDGFRGRPGRDLRAEELHASLGIVALENAHVTPVVLPVGEHQNISRLVLAGAALSGRKHIEVFLGQGCGATAFAEELPGRDCGTGNLESGTPQSLVYQG